MSIKKGEKVKFRPCTDNYLLGTFPNPMWRAPPAFGLPRSPSVFLAVLLFEGQKVCRRTSAKSSRRRRLSGQRLPLAGAEVPPCVYRGNQATRTLSSTLMVAGSLYRVKSCPDPDPVPHSRTPPHHVLYYKRVVLTPYGFFFALRMPREPLTSFFVLMGF